MYLKTRLTGTLATKISPYRNYRALLRIIDVNYYALINGINNNIFDPVIQSDNNRFIEFIKGETLPCLSRYLNTIEIAT